MLGTGRWEISPNNPNKKKSSNTFLEQSQTSHLKNRVKIKDMSNEDMGKKEEAEEINLEEIDEYLDSLNLERKQNLKISDDLTLSQIDLDEIDNYLNELAFEHLNMAAPSNEMQIVDDMIDLKACTAHKVQGSTVPKPQKLTINTNDAFGPAMIYVMLSRVCALSQI